MLDLRQKEILTFDCYGTLIDWEAGLNAALQPILRRHGMALAADAVLERYAALEAEAERGPYHTYRETLQICLRQLGDQLGFAPTPEEVAQFGGSVADWPAFSDSAQALAALKTRYKLVILSNVDDDLFAFSNQKLGVTFDAIITAQQVGGYKPGLGHFQRALTQLNRPAASFLHVAQSLFHDHVPAKQLGWDTVWVNRRLGKPGFGATPPAHALPDLEVPDMATAAQRLLA